MFTGKDLGAAVRTAMKKKGMTQIAVAKEFGIKQPSVSEWTRFGRVGKEHLVHLVEFFADVVGPEHWGLPPTWGKKTSPLPSQVVDRLFREIVYDILDSDFTAKNREVFDDFRAAVELRMEIELGIATKQPASRSTKQQLPGG